MTVSGQNLVTLCADVLRSLRPGRWADEQLQWHHEHAGRLTNRIFEQRAEIRRLHAQVAELKQKPDVALFTSQAKEIARLKSAISRVRFNGELHEEACGDVREQFARLGKPYDSIAFVDDAARHVVDDLVSATTELDTRRSELRDLTDALQQPKVRAAIEQEIARCSGDDAHFPCPTCNVLRATLEVEP